MISSELKTRLRAGTRASRQMVCQNKTASICWYSWYRFNGDFAASLDWKKGDMLRGKLSEYRPKEIDLALKNVLADAAIACLASGAHPGSIWAGKEFCFWHVASGDRAPIETEIVECEITAPAFLTSVYSNSPRPDLLSAIARRLRRGQSLQIYRKKDPSAHERMALSAVLCPVGDELGLSPEDIDSALWNSVQSKATPHNLWRLPEGNPDVALFLNDKSHFVQAIVPLYDNP